MQSSFTVNTWKQPRAVNLGQRSGGTATRADVLLTEQTLSAHWKPAFLRAREGEVCHMDIDQKTCFISYFGVIDI
jgi:hypothetical protein